MGEDFVCSFRYVPLTAECCTARLSLIHMCTRTFTVLSNLLLCLSAHLSSLMGVQGIQALAVSGSKCERVKHMHV